MPVKVHTRHWTEAIVLQIAIRIRFFIITYGGLKPFFSDLSGYPSKLRPKNAPKYDVVTKAGFLFIWFITACLREVPILYFLAGKFGFITLLQWVHNWVSAYTERQIKASGYDASAHHDIPLPEYDWQHGTAEEFYELFVKHPQPVVLRGFMKDRPLLQNMSWETIMARFAEEDVLLTKKELDGFPGKLKEVDNPQHYLHNSEVLFNKYPEIRDYFEYPRLEDYSHMKVGYEQIFIGREGTGTPFHHAANYNFFYQITGAKRWYFIESFDTFLMYPIAIFGRAANASMCLYPDVYNKQAFPLFHYAPVYSTVLQPGDVLYNPAFWWHAIKNDVTPTSVAVASRWHTNGICGGWSNLSTAEENYDIYRVGSLFFFLGAASYQFLHGILQTPSPRYDEHQTLREKNNRFVHRQWDMHTNGGLQVGGVTTKF